MHCTQQYNSDSADDEFHKIKLKYVPVDIDVWFTESQFLIAVLKLENNKSSGRDTKGAHLNFKNFQFFGNWYIYHKGQILCLFFYDVIK